MFMNDGGMADYREVFSSKSFYAFDEFAGMVSICKKHKVKTYYDTIYADIAVTKRRVTLRKHPNYERQLIYWRNGMVLRSYIDNDSLITEEYLYCHFQKKHPESIQANIGKPNAFAIQGQKFIDISDIEVSKELVKQLSDYEGKKEDVIDKLLYYQEKIKKFLEAPLEGKKIWIRRKRFTKGL